MISPDGLDPSKSWREALRLAWANEEGSSGREFWFVLWLSFLIPPYSALLVCMGKPTFLEALPWATLACFPGWYLAWWRAYTRPRMPTVWEVAAGVIIVALLPLVTACRTLAGWVREASQEVSDHDRGAGQ